MAEVKLFDNIHPHGSVYGSTNFKRDGGHSGELSLENIDTIIKELKSRGFEDHLYMYTIEINTVPKDRGMHRYNIVLTDEYGGDGFILKNIIMKIDGSIEPKPITTFKECIWKT
jgi:hypothetical protein